MKAIDRIQEFKGLIFKSERAPHWWEKLKGEVRQGRAEDRYLEKTLDAHLGQLVQQYRVSKKRDQYFFSEHGAIDGIFEGIGVEEKCVALSRDKVLDGILSRGLVWALGNPQGVADGELGATGIFVTLPGPALDAELAGAFFGAVMLANTAGVYPFFVNGETGDYWPRDASVSSALPAWLCESGASPLVAPPLSIAALDELDRSAHVAPSTPFFGSKKVFTSEIIGGAKVAIADWGNEWQMIDVGLMLRAMGHEAVKVHYKSDKPLKLGAHGVEKRVARELRTRFGVILDWGIELG